MSNIHTLSSLSKSATASKQSGTQIGSTVYKTEGLGAGLLRHATKAAGGAAAASGTGKGKSGGGQKLGNVRDLGSISKKLTSGLFGSASRDTALDKQLASAARQKQQSGLPMTADLRLAAMSQREPIRPEAKLLCPNQHKIAGPAVKKALTKGDVYTCTEEGCGALCGGADAHPLHLELKFLNPVDKHKYVDSVRWLSMNDVEEQTREYIRGHPLVYPHLAAGVLMNDETDAWHGWVLGLNIYFWFGDIARYWDKARKELEEREGDPNDNEDEEGNDAEDGQQQLGRGKRKRRRLIGVHAATGIANEAAQDEDDAAAAAAAAPAAAAANPARAAAAAAPASPARTAAAAGSGSPSAGSKRKAPSSPASKPAAAAAATAAAAASPSSSAQLHTDEKDVIEIE